MKYGFRIVYHKSLDENSVKDFLDTIKKQFCGPGSYGCRSDSGAFYRRGHFGFLYNDEYTFRRLSKNRRIFGLVPISILERKDGQPIELNQCMCGIHRAGQKVKFKTPIDIDKEFNVYFETGEIKG